MVLSRWYLYFIATMNFRATAAVKIKYIIPKSVFTIPSLRYTAITLATIKTVFILIAEEDVFILGFLFI